MRRRARQVGRAVRRCGAWNSLVEEVPSRGPSGRAAVGGPSMSLAPGASRSAALCAVEGGAESRRWHIGTAELDFVLGGGVVPGSVILIGGEPGSEIHADAAGGRAPPERTGVALLYVVGRGEPCPDASYAPDRLGEDAGDVLALGETASRPSSTTAAATPPQVLIVDSIQTVYTARLEGAPWQRRAGARVRRATHALRQGGRAPRCSCSWGTSPRAAASPAQDARAHRGHGAVLRG